MNRKTLPVLGFTLTLGLILGAVSASAQDVHLIAVIPVPGNPLTAFDISWVDEPTQTYFLADRSNFGVDIIDAANNAFLARLCATSAVGKVENFVCSSQSRFAGPSTSNDTAGPNGVVYIDSLHQVWAGDGDSTVKVLDVKTTPPGHVTARPVAIISTGGTARADEMSFDQRDHLILVANDADSPPFVSFISTQTDKVVGRLTFDNATNGLEQSLYDPDTQLFYLSVPEINGDPATGEIAVIEPRSMTVVNHYPVFECQPAGLAQGPHDNLLVGCADHDAVTFGPKLIILDIRTGAILTNITQVGGADEVWFNKGDNRFYVAARDNPSGPELGVIDAVSNTWLQNVTTAFNAHSVAADRKNNHVFVPLRPPRAGHSDPNLCVTASVPEAGPALAGKGCIGVYGH